MQSKYDGENIILSYERDNKPFSFSAFASLFSKGSKQIKAYDYFEKGIKIWKSGNKMGTAAIFRTVRNEVVTSGRVFICRK